MVIELPISVMCNRITALFCTLMVTVINAKKDSPLCAQLIEEYQQSLGGSYQSTPPQTGFV